MGNFDPLAVGDRALLILDFRWLFFHFTRSHFSGCFSPRNVSVEEKLGCFRYMIEVVPFHLPSRFFLSFLRQGTPLASTNAMECKYIVTNRFYGYCHCNLIGEGTIFSVVAYVSFLLRRAARETSATFTMWRNHEPSDSTVDSTHRYFSIESIKCVSGTHNTVAALTNTFFLDLFQME